MKRTILIITISFSAVILYSQYPLSFILEPEEDTIGQSIFDLQTNASMPKRMHVFDDGSIGATFTYGMNYGSYSDRGSGYNYFDGFEWLDWSTERIESERTGWPSYAPFGENGEIIVSHLSGAPMIGLLFNKREIKGTGEWDETLFQGPASNPGLLWPRMVTGGENNNSIYLIALTLPIANNGSIYQGLDGALLYSRSTDGGENWDIQNQILPGMDSTEYTGFKGDSYAFAYSKENIVAFVIGSNKHDLFLMKSTDYGQSFEKTIIWNHPYNLITPTFPIDTFYCVDGSLDVAIDVYGMAHIVFGITSSYYFNTTYGDWRIVRSTDGLGYWNENMDSFSSNINALNPSNHPESELIPDYNLIGWAQDLNGNDTIDIEDDSDLSYYYLGLSSMPQIHIDDQNRFFVVYSSITEGYTGGITNQTYRHLWCRTSPNGQWWGKFTDLTNAPEHLYDECIFPSIASYSDDNFYLVYHKDDQPGLQHQGGEPPGDNYINYMVVNKDEVWTSIDENNLSVNHFEVSQNYPNPFSKTTTLKVNLRKATNINLAIFNLVGQKVYESGMLQTKAGINNITISGTDLTSGIYFYTVKAGESSITKKMIVE